MEIEDLSNLVMQSLSEAKEAIDNECERYSVEAVQYLNQVKNYYCACQTIEEKLRHSDGLKQFFVKKAKESIDNKKAEIEYLKFYDLPERKNLTYIILGGFAVVGLAMYSISPAYAVAPMFICGHMMARRLMQAINNKKARVVKKNIQDDNLLLGELEKLQPETLCNVLDADKHKILSYLI